MTLDTVLQYFVTFSPVIVPALVWLLNLAVRHYGGTRFAKLQQIASTVVPAVEQQANGGWTNDQKYNAAAQGLSLLAARFGYRVNAAEVKLLVEGAVANFKSLKSSASIAPSSDAEVSSVADSAQSDSPTQTVDASAGAV